MGKQLINRQNVEEFICRPEQRIYLDNTMILSPGGRDYLNEKGIAIVYGERPSPEKVAAPSNANPQGAALRATIMDLLQREYGITESCQVNEIISKVMWKLEQDR